MNKFSYLTNKTEATFDVDMALPGSKSVSLRTLILASLARGTSQIRELGECDDTEVMIEALRTLGVKIEKHLGVTAVEGLGGSFALGHKTLHAGLSGTTARFLLAIALLRRDRTTIDGLPPLQARPNGELLDAIHNLGGKVERAAQSDLPVTIEGPTAAASKVSIGGGRSSQYVSALLQVAPLLKHGLQLEIATDLVSKPYVDITINTMALFGVHVERIGPYRYDVAPQAYRASSQAVEGDASAASYFAMLATLHGSRVRFTNLGNGTRQGDFRFLDICERLGARVHRGAHETIVEGPAAGRLRKLDAPIDMTSMPDVAPTLIAVAPLVPGGATITGLSTLRLKECDRLAVPAKHLRSLGANLREGPDSIAIEPGLPPAKERTPIATFDDHRIAMSFAVLGTKLSGLEILDAGCVNKTYPNFWRDFERCSPKP